jgi:hypothetical protein
MLRVFRVAAACALATLAFTAGASPAQAATVTCGQTITVNTTVDNDLTCPSGNGLVIGANGITLDLNGHTIAGSENIGTGGGVGIVISGRTGATVRNGTVTGFKGVGVSLSGSSGVLLSDLDVSAQPFTTGAVSVDAASSANRLVALRLFPRPLTTALFLAGDGNLVRDSEMGAVCFSTLSVTGDGNRIEGNVVSHEFLEGTCSVSTTPYASAIEVNNGDGNEVVANTANDNNSGNGVFVGAAATGTRVQGNVASGNTSLAGPGFPEYGGDGIRVESASTTIVGNLADGNSELGIRGVAGVTDGGGNTAQKNADSRQCVNVVCDSSLLGSRSVGPSFSAMSTNVKRVSPFVVYYPVRVSEVNAYLDGGGAASGSQTVRGLIYRSASGQPTSLVATSSVMTIDAGRPPGFVDLPVSGSPVLQPGVYWLGLHSGLTHGVARFAWNAVANHRRYYIDAFGDGAGSPFGPSLVDDQQITIFASGLYGAGGGSARR